MNLNYFRLRKTLRIITWTIFIGGLPLGKIMRHFYPELPIRDIWEYTMIGLLCIKWAMQLIFSKQERAFQKAEERREKALERLLNFPSRRSLRRRHTAIMTVKVFLMYLFIGFIITIIVLSLL